MPQAPRRHPTALCAVVLAAGEGARLRPLTLIRPKALCPVDNQPLVDHAIARAHTVTTEVAVNVHHGREALAAHLDGRVHVSIEEPEALGTAGALGLLRPWIAGRAVLLLNADTWVPGSLDRLVAEWDGERVRLSLAGEDSLRADSRLVAALLPWDAVAALRAEPSGLYEVSWKRLAAEGRIDAVAWSGPWHDCGTPARYLAANLAASGGHSVIGSGARVDGTVERSVVWPRARVGAAEHLVNAIRTDTGMTVLVR